MSTTQVNPMTIESEVEQIGKFLDELDLQLRNSNSKFFGSQMSIADILYYQEISTLQHLLKREIIPPNSEIAVWFHESMKTEEIRTLDQKSLEAHSKVDRRSSAGQQLR